MGWMGPGEHEGWVAMVYADGAVSSGTSNGLGHYLPGALMPGGGYDETMLRPFADTVAWRMECECGWFGPTVSVPRPSKYNEPTEDEEETLLLPTWQAHVAPFRATEDLRDLADQMHALSEKIDTAVDAARQGGASWQDIGQALGVTRQAAQQRYGRAALSNT